MGSGTPATAAAPLRTLPAGVPPPPAATGAGAAHQAPLLPSTAQPPPVAPALPTQPMPPGENGRLLTQ
jgi:hypothetical protein